MNIATDGPAEPEHAGRKQHRGEEGRHESVFLRAEAVLLDVGLEVVVDVGDVDDNADDAADDDTQEDDAEFADVEAEDADVNQGKGLEEGVVDA